MATADSSFNMSLHGAGTKTYRIHFETGEASLINMEKLFLKLMHGSTMATVWALIVMAGILVARFMRHYSWCFRVHRLLMVLAVVLTVPIIFIARSARTVGQDNSWGAASPHKIMGYIIVVSSWCQAGLGYTVMKIRNYRGNSRFLPLHWLLTFYKQHNRSQYVAAVHRWNGRLLELCALSQIFMGALTFQAQTGLSDRDVMQLTSSWVVLAIVGFVTMEFIGGRSSRKRSEDQVLSRLKDMSRDVAKQTSKCEESFPFIDSVCMPVHGTPEQQYEMVMQLTKQNERVVLRFFCSN